MGKKFITYNGTIVGNGGLTLLSTETDTPTPPSFTNTKSILLDGVDDYVNVADNSNLSFGNGSSDSPFSISAWVKMTDSTRFYILNKGLVFSTNYEYLLNINASDKLGLFLYDSSNNSRIGRLYNTALTSYENQWVHICSTYNGSGLSSGIKVYLNGVRVDDTDSNSGTYVAMENGNRPLNIGRTETALYSNGNIDETAVFNSELSQSDITSIYNGGVPNDISSLSPVSWWRCGDGDTSPTLTDNGSGGNNGTMTNFSTFSTDVPVELFSRKSIALDGVDDFVDMGNVLNFERLDTFSISAWVKKNDNGAGMMIVAKQETSLNFKGWMFYFDSANNLKFVLRRQNQTFNRLIATSTNSISSGSWNHVLVTYDGSSTEAGFNFYINGADAGSNGSGGTLGGGASLATTIPLQIGTRNSTFNLFEGNIDEVSIFNTELSASDVTTIYNGGVPNDISSLSPLSWWRCGDGDTSPTLTDNGSGGNDGTMTNFTTFSTDVPT